MTKSFATPVAFKISLETRLVLLIETADVTPNQLPTPISPTFALRRLHRRS